MKDLTTGEIIGMCIIASPYILFTVAMYICNPPFKNKKK